MTRSICAILILATAAGVAMARVVPNWSYEKLTREADLVVIATASANVATPDEPSSEPFRKELTGVETKFTVRAVLKGKLDGDTLKLLHFRLKGQMPPNGPSLVSFQTPDEGKVNSVPDYLLFLKQRADGRFEPVTGHADSSLSVRQIGTASER